MLDLTACKLYMDMPLCAYIYRGKCVYSVGGWGGGGRGGYLGYSTDHSV